MVDTDITTPIRCTKGQTTEKLWRAAYFAFSNTQTNKRNRRRNPRVLFPFVIKTLLNQLSYCVKKESKTKKTNFLLLTCLSHPTPKMSSYFILFFVGFCFVLFLFCSHFGLLDVDFRNWREREAASVFCLGIFPLLTPVLTSNF